MADYAITGKKGTGKSLFAIGVIRDALRAKKRVVTNLNVYLDHLLAATSKATLTRIPDRPTVEDMEAIGEGRRGRSKTITELSFSMKLARSLTRVHSATRNANRCWTGLSIRASSDGTCITSVRDSARSTSNFVNR